MGRNKRAKSVRKTKAHQQKLQEEEYTKTPHSMVFHRGNVGKVLEELVKNMRDVMEPYTATSLQVRNKNTLKDFLSVAGALNVTHFMVFTKNDLHTNLRVLRTPKGPTLTFQLHKFTLTKDVLSSLRKPDLDKSVYRHHPLLVLNNFGGEGMQMKLMSTMFQNMFPSINVNKVNLNTIRRCVLVNYDSETKLIEFRHYSVRAAPVGVSRGVKKLLKSHIPDLSRYADVSEYLAKGCNLSESEAEFDGPHNEVTLPQNVFGRGNMKSSQSAIRLKEIGPRMTLQLIMIEEGCCDGKVLFHEYVKKTERELKEIQKLKKQKQSLKEARRKQQEINIAKKAELKAQHKEKSLEGIRRSTQMRKEAESLLGDIDQTKKSNDNEDDDVDYYEREVGVKPAPELFSGVKRKHHGDTKTHSKKFKKDEKYSKKESQYKKKGRQNTDSKTKFRVKAKATKPNRRPTTVSGGKRTTVFRPNKRSNKK
ncbi:hypothetical protein LOTGIDRAFT_184139 [Lottia gigantea]|uniref:Brix domain-containing protein n=1 Tax=Lottia gigantea TaxID=225164 RepID=V3ZT72_LOTGI|nr:hypothetical protein LOTGIDRAFT_184139 [Lottia gigantea]ESO84096.1 hypothetical protein LOTGIDRAFT_184139 [Lottia gigantea]